MNPLDDDAIDRAARAHGIASRYTDVWGNTHAVGADTKRALLRAMGVDAGLDDAGTYFGTNENTDSGATANASEGAPATAGNEGIAPVYVLRNDGTACVRFSLPESTPVSWRLTTEAGEQYAGTIDEPPLAEFRTDNGTIWRRREWRPPAPLADGYHRLTLEGTSAHATMLVLTPGQCYTPPVLRAGGRVWGFALQLYALRSARNWGIGDFTDLQYFVSEAARLGAAAVGLNPLHALFAQRPEQASPYSPSSRLFLNALYIDTTAIADYGECARARARVESDEFRAELARLRAGEHVDYAGVARAKYAIVEMLYAHFRAEHLAKNDARAQAFRAFQAAGGENLRRFAIHEALQERFAREDANLWGWPVWPEAYRDPHAPAVQQFARDAHARCEFYQYLQWQADIQLKAADDAANAVGLTLGLYRDLAVGVDRGGADAWAAQDLYALGASVGCPPDDFNLHGQNWGLPPMLPHALRAAAYAPFIETLRANMQHTGALRIDHVMGLMRLFWVPAGVRASEGGYVHYPLADLLGILALESQRQRCLVIGEDLGTVPGEIRAALADLGVLSYRLLFFERGGEGEFLAPSAYRAQALVAASTHDLATLAGFWAGQDIAERTRLGLFPSPEMAASQVQARRADKRRLLAALAQEGLVDADHTDPDREFTPALMQAIHAYLARTPSQVLLVQPEDALMQSAPVNLPGTTDERPNWRQKLVLNVEEFFTDARVVALAAAMTRERPPVGEGSRGDTFD